MAPKKPPVRKTKRSTRIKNGLSMKRTSLLRCKIPSPAVSQVDREKEDRKNRRELDEKLIGRKMYEEHIEEYEMKCDLEHLADHDEKNWPRSAFYYRISKNVLGQDLHMDALKAIRIGQQRDHRICCKCKARGTKCEEDKKCECRLMGERLKEMKFGTALETDQVLEPKDGDEFHKTTFVACGVECLCRGECGLNIFKGLDDLEVVVRRRDEKKGFGLYAFDDLEEGQAVRAFVGEFCGPKTANTGDAARWSLTSNHKEGSGDNNHLLETLYKASGLNKPAYKKALAKAYDSHVLINPLLKGNSSRFINHSCDPNLSMWRVIRNGINPTDVTVLFFANKDIPMGTELTFDYGDDYKKEHFKSGCFCDPCMIERREKKALKKALKEASKKASQNAPKTSSVNNASVVPRVKPAMKATSNKIKGNSK